MLKRFEDYADTYGIDVVTFDFKGTRVCCFVSGYSDYQMGYSKMQIIFK